MDFVIINLMKELKYINSEDNANKNNKESPYTNNRLTLTIYNAMK